VTFTLSLILLYSLRATAASVPAEDGDVAALRSGLRYAKSRPDIVGTYIIDLLAMVLAFPIVMLPFRRRTIPRNLCPGAALLRTSEWRSHSDLDVGMVSQNPSVRASDRLRGGALGSRNRSFGYSSSLWFVFLGLAIGGGADAISGIFRTTMWNESIPPEMRGRMAGIEMISYSLGPTAGQFRAGVMAAWTTLRFSLTFGGLACTGSVGARRARPTSTVEFRCPHRRARRRSARDAFGRRPLRVLTTNRQPLRFCGEFYDISRDGEWSGPRGCRGRALLRSHVARS